ncbi:hypothetical protein CSIRO_2103 [Bradyrhizobiaceae bacterium SG-6C]|nr:hypothetical protein CSIRO_2103 [Bradyrhizobiaceae bacterium SG-6C]
MGRQSFNWVHAVSCGIAVGKLLSAASRVIVKGPVVVKDSAGPMVSWGQNRPSVRQHYRECRRGSDFLPGEGRRISACCIRK